MSMYNFLKCPSCGYKFTAREGAPHWIPESHELHPVRIAKEIEQGLHGTEIKQIMNAMDKPVQVWVEEGLYACDVCKKLCTRERIWLNNENGKYLKATYYCKTCNNLLRFIPSSRWSRVRCPKCLSQMVETPGGIQ